MCVKENGKAHHSERFELMQRDNETTGESPSLVVRRGQAFKLKLECNRPSVRDKDSMTFIFTVADDEKPSYGHGTLAGTSLKSKAEDLGDPLEWGVSIESVMGTLLEVRKFCKINFGILENCGFFFCRFG